MSRRKSTKKQRRSRKNYNKSMKKGGGSCADNAAPYSSDSNGQQISMGGVGGSKEKMGGSGMITDLAVPAALLVLNQAMSKNKRSFQKRRSFRKRR